MSYSTGTFVTMVSFDNSFILLNIYHLLPIINICGFQFKKKMIIPYFGTPDSIVSVIPPPGSGLKNRGIRTIHENENLETGFGNSVGIDFQCFDKNLHIKISSSQDNISKFHVTGTKDVEWTQIAANKLVDYLKKTDLAWRPFFELDINGRYELISYFINIIIRENKFLIYTDNEMKDFLSLVRNNKYYLIFDFLARYTLEHKSIQELYNKYLTIAWLNIGNMSVFHLQNDFSLKKISISLGVYHTNLGYKNLCLSYISKIIIQNEELINDLYSVQFINIKQNKIILMAPVKNHEYKEDFEKSSKMMTYLFHISKTGSVKLFTGINKELAIKEGMRILNILTNIIESAEYKKYNSQKIQIQSSTIENYDNSWFYNKLMNQNINNNSYSYESTNNQSLLNYDNF